MPGYFLSCYQVVCKRYALLQDGTKTGWGSIAKKNLSYRTTVYLNHTLAVLSKVNTEHDVYVRHPHLH